MAITSLFLNLEGWLTPHFKGFFIAFPTKYKFWYVIYKFWYVICEVLIFVKNPSNLSKD